jgi:nicotinamidase-related amidase
MRFDKENCVAVIVDVQERLFATMQHKEQLENNLFVLIKGLLVLDVPLIKTQQYTSGLGPTIESVDGAMGALPAVEKLSFSCCGEPSFMEALEKVGREQVVLAGIESHVCVLQTALDLVQNGYIPMVVQDCVSSRRQSDMAAAFLRMRAEGVRITSYESILLELCREAGGDTFKQILRLIK